MDQDIEAEEEDREARNAIKAIKALRDSQGWLYIKKIIAAQVKVRTDNVMLTPRKDMATEWEREFQKGEAAFGLFILDLVDNEIETLSAVKEVEDGRNTAAVTSAPDVQSAGADPESGRDLWD